MDADELFPTAKKAEKKDLEVMSVEAIEEYIAELETEISRCRDAIELKKDARAGAESVFKR